MFQPPFAPPFAATFSQQHLTLVTGATGTLGRALIAKLLADGTTVRVLSRQPNVTTHAAALNQIIADLAHPETLRGCCENVDTIFHLASYSPREQPTRYDHDQEHWRITYEGTRALLDEARHAGVRRFVFASSVKAMGEHTSDCATEASTSVPASGYGRAKLAAEELMRGAHGIETSILRFTPMYGPHSEGWVTRFIDLARAGYLPPLPTTENHRSMVHVDDAADALQRAAKHPSATNRTYIVTDGVDYSTRAIYEAIRSAFGCPVPRWSVPVRCFSMAASLGEYYGKIFGRPAPFNRDSFNILFRSAYYSNSRICEELGWRPTKNLFDTIPDLVQECALPHAR